MDRIPPPRRPRVCAGWSMLFILLLASRTPAEETNGTSAVPETGTSCVALVSLDQLMRSFIRDNGLPGAALAVAQEGRLVYARGFGYADAERTERVQPDSLFRIASISKPITAVAVLQLVDQGKLHLDDRVSDLLPPLPGPATASCRDPRWHDVTVRHLLQHRGGWDREFSQDPMFRSTEIAARLGIPSPPGPRDIIRFMVDQHLDFDPGARYAYSNFGYCLLGRVIEHVSGTDYETHVRTRLLAPLGIDRMRIGRTTPAGRADGEVGYIDPTAQTGPSVVEAAGGSTTVPGPYGTWCLEAMDAHGGWIASAIDLVRFASRIQDPAPHGLLSLPSYTAMTARPPGAAGVDDDNSPRPHYYGLGWSVRPAGSAGRHNLWHAGGFAGSSTLLVIRHDRFCWAVLFNTSATVDGATPADKIDSLVHQAVDAVPTWPADDQFPQWLGR